METIAGFSIIPIIVGLVELGKRIGISAQFAPLLAVLFGIGFAWLSAGAFSTAVLVGGIVLGLSASGLWSGAKAVSGH